MFRGFWDTLPNPIIALAPMDGVTDAPFRYIIDKYGSPDVLFTEFTSVEGLDRGAVKLLQAFIYHKTDTPTAAQVFGSEPDPFYRAAFIVAEMGYDGFDINMGCPDPSVAKRGAGAGLILRPENAKQIIEQSKQGLKDWSEGRTIEEAGVHPDIIAFIRSFLKTHNIQVERKLLPLSVKTRIGYDEIVTESWISHLLEQEPANISLHGRTLRQLYSGLANWDEIAKAAVLAKKTKTTLLGNGDIKSFDEAQYKIKTYGVNGVLIGRASIGNPWVFKQKTGDLQEHFDIAIEHSRKFEELLPEGHFLTLRKHLAWYAKGFNNAAEARMQLVRTNNADEVEEIIKQIKAQLDSKPQS